MVILKYLRAHIGTQKVGAKVQTFREMTKFFVNFLM